MRLMYNAYKVPRRFMDTMPDLGVDVRSCDPKSLHNVGDNGSWELNICIVPRVYARNRKYIQHGRVSVEQDVWQTRRSVAVIVITRFSRHQYQIFHSGCPPPVR